ncbi:hypothetical protein VE03_07343 [Pseudogymnoascus sp. 23342-1-I1]|nr:hypothetical protein VE03_07343 [Pseudogymnoascus sp. 23342-1-I1]
MPKWLEKIRSLHLAYLLLTLVVITSVFSMVGCISEAPGIYQLFIAELRGSNVQFGYIGICSTVADHDRVCKPALGTTSAVLAKKLSLSIDVMDHVLALQGSLPFALPVISDVLIFCGHFAFLVALYSTGEKSVKSRRRWIATTQIILWGAVGSAFPAAYLLNFSISAMEVVVPNSSAELVVTRGVSLRVLQWVVFGFTVLYVITIHTILHNIVKQAREGIPPILPTSAETGTQPAASSAETETKPAAAETETKPAAVKQTSTGTQSDSPASQISDLLKVLKQISAPKKAVQDSEAQFV